MAETVSRDDSHGSRSMFELDCAAAEVLGGRICAAAALNAQAQCQLLDLIGEFDAGNAVRWWDGIKSLAHWLSWACSMSPGTAREHVRVARALGRMPTTRAAFAEGRLSFSKVREISRVVDTVDEAELCQLALRATAAQLAKTVAGYRTAAGTRIKQQRDRQVSWTEREAGTIDLRLRLPKEEAAIVFAALNAAKDQFGSPPTCAEGSEAAASPPGQAESASAASTAASPAASPADLGKATPAYTLADAFLDVARGFLSTSPADRSGEDRSLVVVHVAADQLAESEPSADPSADDGSQHGAVPAEPETDPDLPAGPEPDQDVPAGTPATEPACQLQGLGGIEPETARKHACDGDLLGAVIDAHSDVLALGRTHRLVTRALRRALMIRDHGMCQFTACHQTRHLKAHHLIHWADGGPTDLSNLILLCQFHHTAVHEGCMTIRRPDVASGRPGAWEFLMPDGKPHRDWYSAEGLLGFLAAHADRTRAEQHRARLASVIANVDAFRHPDARRIQPGWRGERYDRHEAVQALFRMPATGTRATGTSSQEAA